MFENELRFNLTKCQMMEAKGINVEYSYEEKDSKGRLLYHEGWDHKWIRYEYDERGNNTYKESSEGQWQRVVFNGFNKEKYIETDQGIKVNLFYDKKRRHIRTEWLNNDDWIKKEYGSDFLGDYMRVYNDKGEEKLVRFNEEGKECIEIMRHKETNEFVMQVDAIDEKQKSLIVRFLNYDLLK